MEKKSNKTNNNSLKDKKVKTNTNIKKVEIDKKENPASKKSGTNKQENSTNKKVNSANKKAETSKKVNSINKKVEQDKKVNATSKKVETNKKINTTRKKVETNKKINATSKKLETNKKGNTTSKKLKSNKNNKTTNKDVDLKKGKKTDKKDLVNTTLKDKKNKINKEESNKKKKIIFTILMSILIVIAVSGIIYISYYTITSFKDKRDYTDILSNIKINEDEIKEEKTERMLQLEELQKENDEIIGWLEVEGTDINYPVTQTKDNDFYLTHNYKKEYSQAGCLFLDKDFDMINGSSNYLIYGHRNKNGIMFESLLKYSKEDFYKEHTKIRFTTNKDDSKYEIMSIFYSRVYYQSEQNVFRYYYFVNAENEEEYNEYVNNCKNASIFDTGVTATYGDQLLTLSTCEYSQEDGRFVIVAKKVEE